MHIPLADDEQAAIDRDGLEPPDHEIAALAHHFWTERGCPGGSPEDDWFQAEAVLKNNTLPEATTARPETEERFLRQVSRERQNN